MSSEMNFEINFTTKEEFFNELGCSEEVFYDFLERYYAGRLDTVSSEKVVSIAEAIKLYLVSLSASKKKQLVGSLSTRESQLNNFTRIVEELEGVSATQVMLHEVSYETMEAYIYMPTKKCVPPSPSTRNNRRTAIRSVCKYSNTYGYAIPSAIENLKYEKAPKSLPKFLYLNEIVELLSMSKATRHGIRNHAIIAFMVITGCRLSELINIKTHQLDFGAKLVRTPLRKGGFKKDTKLFLTDYLIEVLQYYIRIDRPDISAGKPISEYLFCNLSNPYRGKKLTSENVYKMIDKLLKKLQISDPERTNVTVHSLRHSCAVLSLLAGADIIEVQELLGHVLLSTTQEYTKITNSLLQKKVEQFSPFKEVTMEQYNYSRRKATIKYYNESSRKEGL